MNLQKQNLKIIVYLLFIISGIAGLIYQIVWFKYLSLFLGNTTYAQTTVLAAFLGGLALGNFIFGKRADSFSNPVLVYSVLEIFIGIYCFAYPFLSGFFENIFLQYAPALNPGSKNILFNASRFIIAALLLVVPATAMGGTLPVLSKFFVEKIQNARREVAILYFLNSFGAFVGIIFAGFILIKEFGLPATVYATAGLNVAAGITGFIISFRNKNVAAEAEYNYSPETGAEEKLETTDRLMKIIVAVAGLSGMSALIYEMVWVRLLINFFGSSTYAFSIMLLAFIGGITLGSFIVSQNYFKRYNYIKLLAFSQGAIGFSTMLALLFYERLPYYFWKISALLSRTPEAFSLFLLSEFVLTFMIIAVPTLFMGMSLPLASEIFSASNRKIGFSVGRIFSVNTVGTVAGTVLAGLVFIPNFGIKVSFEIGIALNLTAALLILWSYNLYSIRSKIIFSVFIISASVLYLISFTGWNKSVLIKGIFRSLNSAPPSSFEEFSKNQGEESILFYKEGIGSTVAVSQENSNPDRKRLIIDGKPDASSYFDMPTQVLLAQIPMMLHKNPQNVFVVGFGSGTTIGSVLTHPVKKITCAEISKGVIEASRFFRKENRNCLNDPRLKLINEDALTLLKLSKEKYDVIISEPSNPWIAGIGNLFSKEYFEKCSESLSPDGIMVQWFHLYAAEDDVVKLVLNTFSSVFPYAQLWSSVGNDIILVGSKKEIRFNAPLLESKFSSSLVKADFERIGIQNLFTFLSCQNVSPRGFYLMSNDNPINSELHPRLEFLAPKSFYIGKPSSYIYPFDEKFDTASGGLLVKELVKISPPGKSSLISAVEYFLKTNANGRYAYGLSSYLKELYPDDYNSNYLFAKSVENISSMNYRSPLFVKLTALFPDSARSAKDLGNALILEKTNATTFLKLFSINKEADAFLKTTNPDQLSKLKVYLQLTSAFLLNSEYVSAADLFSKAETALNASPDLAYQINGEEFLYLGAVVNMHAADYQKVISYYLALVNNNRNYSDRFHLRRMMSWQRHQQSINQK